jgi:hypothetical protein
MVYTYMHILLRVIILLTWSLLQHWGPSDPRDVPTVGSRSCQTLPTRRLDREDDPILPRPGWPTPRGNPLLPDGCDLPKAPVVAGCGPHTWGGIPEGRRWSAHSYYGVGRAVDGGMQLD